MHFMAPPPLQKYPANSREKMCWNKVNCATLPMRRYSAWYYTLAVSPFCELSGDSLSVRARMRFHNRGRGLPAPGRSAPPPRARGRWPW